jgi:hypothetical protein
MIHAHVQEMLAPLDRPDASGQLVADRLQAVGPVGVTVRELEGPHTHTDHLQGAQDA